MARQRLVRKLSQLAKQLAIHELKTASQALSILARIQVALDLSRDILDPFRGVAED